MSAASDSRAGSASWLGTESGLRPIHHDPRRVALLVREARPRRAPHRRDGARDGAGELEAQADEVVDEHALHEVARLRRQLVAQDVHNDLPRPANELDAGARKLKMRGGITVPQCCFGLDPTYGNRSAMRAEP